MSIEYTIDIQLTELGFPEIVPRNSSGRETSSRSISASQKQKVQHADAAKEASKDAAVRCKPCKSVQEEQVEGKTEKDDPAPAGTVTTTAPTTGQRGDGGGAEVEDDSDDSEVSDACEEEEVDDDEDGLYSGMLWSFP